MIKWLIGTEKGIIPTIFDGLQEAVIYVSKHKCWNATKFIKGTEDELESLLQKARAGGTI